MNMQSFALIEGVCAHMHMGPAADGKLTRGILRRAQKGSCKRERLYQREK